MHAVTEMLLENLSDLVFRPHRLVYGYVPKDIARSSVNVAMHRLEKKGFIQKGMMENEVCIRLTDLGLKHLEKVRAKQKREGFLNEKKISAKWDGKWRIAIFDIPEENKRIRQTLRETLKVLEFWPLQKSVWISKNNFTKELREWVRSLHLEQQVIIFETQDLGFEPVLHN